MNLHGIRRPHQGIRHIHPDRPSRPQPARRCKFTSGRSVSSLPLTSSPNMPPPPSQTPAESKKLAVRLSTVTGCTGLGLFVRKPSPDHDQPVFRDGETIMNVEGTLALRQTQTNGKCLSWLVSQYYCHPLANDSRVIWSDIHYPKKNNVEFGSYPRCIAVYSNDTQKTKPNISISVTDNLPETESFHKKKRKLDLDECPTYTVVALRDINYDEELLWSYGREGKDSTDYSGSYLKPYNQNKHKRLITRITHNIINLEKFPVIVENSDTFDQLRMTHYLGEAVYKPAFTKAELTFCNPYSGNQRFNECLIKSLENDHFPAYLKLRLQLQLKGGHDLSTGIKNILRSLKRFSFTHLPLQKIWDTESIAALYEYCVNHNILLPHQDVGAIPYPWLRLKLEQSPDDGNILELLIKKIRLKLEAPNTTPFYISRKLSSEYIYNPLTKTTHWSAPDLETFTEIATNRINDPLQIDALIKQYNVNNTNDDSFKVTDLARTGHLKALVAIVRKRITNSIKMPKLATEFRKQNTSLLLDGQYVESSTVNMVRFIRENFTGQGDLERMLRIEDLYTNEQLLEKISQSLETRKHTMFERVFLCRLHEIDHNNERIQLSKDYIRIICTRRKTKYPCRALKLMKSTSVLQKEPSLYTLDDLKTLFHGENGPWFQRLFPINEQFSDQFSIDDWKTQFFQCPRGPQRRALLTSIRKAHNKNPKIIQNCIKADFEVSKKKQHANKTKWKNNFCSQHARSLNTYKFTKNNQPHFWSPEDIRKMVR